MTEAEWRIFREVRQAALERLCERIMEKSQKAMQGPGTHHERYLRLYDTVRRGDKDIARAFNDFRRSTALEMLFTMVQLGVVTDQELARFTPQTQETIRFLAGRGE